MEFFITQQLFQRPWESNHKPSAPTNDAPNNIVNTQSPVAVFYTASKNTLINIYSKYRTSRDKLPLSKWPTLLLPSPVTTIGKNSQTRSTCLFCSLALSWVHQTCLSWCQHKCLVLFRARQLSTQSQSGVRSITTFIRSTLVGCRLRAGQNERCSHRVHYAREMAKTLTLRFGRWSQWLCWNDKKRSQFEQTKPFRYDEQIH